MLVSSFQLFVWAAFVMYLATFNYLADWYVRLHLSVGAAYTFHRRSYGPFASSALAGQSLLRALTSFCFNLPYERYPTGNLSGTAFPLFTSQMYAKLTFRWAGTLFGGVALLMMPIPFVVSQWHFFYCRYLVQHLTFSTIALLPGTSNQGKKQVCESSSCFRLVKYQSVAMLQHKKDD